MPGKACGSALADMCSTPEVNETTTPGACLAYLDNWNINNWSAKTLMLMPFIYFKKGFLIIQNE